MKKYLWLMLLFALVGCAKSGNGGGPGGDGSGRPGGGNDPEGFYHGKPAKYWLDHPKSDQADMALALAIKDKDEEVRKGAIKALGDLGPEGKKAVPTLTGYLKDPDTNVRKSAAQVLAKIGDAGKPAYPQLQELLKDPDDGVKEAAVDAIGQCVGAEAKPLMPQL